MPRGGTASGGEEAELRTSGRWDGRKRVGEGGAIWGPWTRVVERWRWGSEVLEVGSEAAKTSFEGEGDEGSGFFGLSITRGGTRDEELDVAAEEIVGPVCPDGLWQPA
ncbi:uncharacterized protein A4U43_C03F31760 [Asparagus officinalis]|uniref:Uncharacterized protein n=1 Tax=Asparagus officinalis TaxID=4686 RepID=A0A5P1FFB6_ASPOF|nr:uncharacterized protein A4U43_C03F31760 [Asparagus officinalis]